MVPLCGYPTYCRLSHSRWMYSLCLFVVPMNESRTKVFMRHDFLWPYVSISLCYILNLGLHSYVENFCLLWKDLPGVFQLDASNEFFRSKKALEECWEMSHGHDMAVIVVTYTKVTQNSKVFSILFYHTEELLIVYSCCLTNNFSLLGCGHFLDFHAPEDTHPCIYWKD